MPTHIAISTLYIVHMYKVRKDKVQKDGSTKYRRTEGRKYKGRKYGSTKDRRREGRKYNVQSTEGEVRCRDATCGVRDTALTASAEGASGSESRK